jgi:hypothetical protein
MTNKMMVCTYIKYYFIHLTYALRNYVFSLQLAFRLFHYTNVRLEVLQFFLPNNSA